MCCACLCRQLPEPGAHNKRKPHSVFASMLAHQVQVKLGKYATERQSHGAPTRWTQKKTLHIKFLARTASGNAQPRRSCRARSGLRWSRNLRPVSKLLVQYIGPSRCSKLFRSRHIFPALAAWLTVLANKSWAKLLGRLPRRSQVCLPTCGTGSCLRLLQSES